MTDVRDPARTATSPVDRLLRLLPYVMLAFSATWTTLRAAAPLHDPDSWFHLALGEYFLDHRTLSAPESWSTFATSEWVPTQPLPEVVVALLHRWLGLPVLVWLFAASVVALVGVVFWLARQYAGPLPAVVATMFFVAAGQNAFTPRPQMVSYLLLAVVVGAWLRTEQDLKPRWWLVPLAWVWSLSHGFWFIGVAYGYVFLVAQLVTVAPTVAPTVDSWPGWPPYPSSPPSSCCSTPSASASSRRRSWSTSAGSTSRSGSGRTSSPGPAWSPS